MQHDVLIPAVVVGTSLALGAALAALEGAGEADAWSGPLAIAALVLVVSGIAKARDPDAATEAVAVVGLPRSSALVRLIGAGEVVLGSIAVLAGGRIAAIGVALAYVAFALVAWRTSHDARAASCGCFGSASARPGPLHVATDAAVVGFAAAAAVSGSGGLVAIVRDTPGAGLPALAGVILGAAAVVAVLTVAADALDAASSTRTSSTTFHLVEDRR